MWYLSEQLVGLAFFDDEVTDEMKVQIVSALTKEGRDNTCKHITIEDADIKLKQLPDFVSAHTKQLLAGLHVSEEFISRHPSEWPMNNNCMLGLSRVRQLKVINDAAERGISLIQNFNSVLTNQEKQKQFLLQVVERHTGLPRYQKVYTDSRFH